MIASAARRIAYTVLGLAAIGVAAAPKPANAWWHGYGWGVGIYVPPVVVAPPPAYYAPPAYYPAPAYYAPPASGWIPGHWQGNYWVPGHWS
jgi:hypothetical protein